VKFEEADSSLEAGGADVLGGGGGEGFLVLEMDVAGEDGAEVRRGSEEGDEFRGFGGGGFDVPLAPYFRRHHVAHEDGLAPEGNSALPQEQLRDGDVDEEHGGGRFRAEVFLREGELGGVDLVCGVIDCEDLEAADLAGVESDGGSIEEKRGGKRELGGAEGIVAGVLAGEIPVVVAGNEEDRARGALEKGLHEVDRVRRGKIHDVARGENGIDVLLPCVTQDFFEVVFEVAAPFVAEMIHAAPHLRHAGVVVRKFPDVHIGDVGDAHGA